MPRTWLSAWRLGFGDEEASASRASVIGLGLTELDSVFLACGFLVGYERFQDCDVGLDFRDVDIQLGHYPPDLVIMGALDLSLPVLSSPSSAE